MLDFFFLASWGGASTFWHPRCATIAEPPWLGDLRKVFLVYLEFREAPGAQQGIEPLVSLLWSVIIVIIIIIFHTCDIQVWYACDCMCFLHVKNSNRFSESRQNNLSHAQYTSTIDCLRQSLTLCNFATFCWTPCALATYNTQVNCPERFWIWHSGGIDARHLKHNQPLTVPERVIEFRTCACMCWLFIVNNPKSFLFVHHCSRAVAIFVGPISTWLVLSVKVYQKERPLTSPKNKPKPWNAATISFLNGFDLTVSVFSTDSDGYIFIAHIW